jgi:predicted nucleic acid-binding protein
MSTRPKVLLDTSAILTHLLDEPGADAVQQHLSAGPDHAHIAAPTLAELERRLADFVRDDAERDNILDQYCRTLCTLVGVDRASVEASIHLRRKSRNRLPLVDALIAGCALRDGMVLVHRDEHLAGIPSKILAQERLPEHSPGLEP